MKGSNFQEGNTFDEAFIARFSVIMSNIGAMAESVQDVVNGLLFRVRDHKDLVKKMEMVATDPDLIDRLKKNIIHVKTIENHALEIREMYCSLVCN